jgi:hypothetical protein
MMDALNTLVPPARRRPATQLIEEALAAAIAEVNGRESDLDKVVAATEFIAQLGEGRRRLALSRMAPVERLHAGGKWSYRRLADAAGLSKNAISQIKDEARGRPRRRRPDED